MAGPRFLPGPHRIHLCFCANLDVRHGVDDDSCCHGCGRLVVIVYLWATRYPAFCKCNFPLMTEFAFCDSCRGAIPAMDGSFREETLLAVRRSLEMAGNNMLQ